MSFASVLQQDNVAHAWLLDVSFDNFATMAYRWSTLSCTVGGFDYEARIPEKGISRITRAFGRDNTPQAGTVTLSLENTDFGADWLVDRATVASQVFKARFKLTLCVYPGFSTPVAGGATQVVGTFKCLALPMRDKERVTVQLADDTMGLFDAPLVSPTLREWKNDAGSTASNCPLHSTYQATPSPDSDWDAPLPLVFGSGRLNCFAAELSHNVGFSGGPSSSGPLDQMRCIPVCATTSGDAVTATDVNYLWGVYGKNVLYKGGPFAGAETTIGIPKTFTVPSNADAVYVPGSTFTIWEPQKTQVLAKDGTSWRILWVKINVQAYRIWYAITRNSYDLADAKQADGSTKPAIIDEAIPYVGTETTLNGQFAAFAYFQVSGWPFSARTVLTSDEQPGVTVIQDLIAYYSHGSASDLDSARFTKARSMSPVPVSGVLQPQRPVSSRFTYGVVPTIANALTRGQLRQAVLDICQSADLDFAMTWSGQLAVYSSYFSFADITASRVTIDETRCQDVIERIPSKGERWAPYNRVFTVSPDGAVHGPFDNPDPNITWSVVLERTLQGKWGYPFSPASPLYSQTIWSSLRRLESVVRPVIRFLTDREALQLDLGDLFNFTWTRGGGAAGPYNTAAVFRVESIQLDPTLLTVTIEAVWVDDIQTTHPYLLDDESFLTRVTPSAGRTITVVDSQRDLTLSSGDLNADGVTTGDILVLKDSSQAFNVFTRNRCLRVSSVINATTVRVNDSDNSNWNFGSPGGIAVSEWEIRRGQETYPTSSSDPTHYPSDGAMYGKACDDNDTNFGVGTANLLI